MKVIVEMSEKQARVIIKALELYFRIRMGQIDAVKNYFDCNTLEVDPIIRQLKTVMVPEVRNGEMDVYSSHSISNPIIGDGRLAYEIMGRMEHDITWHKDPNASLTATLRTPYLEPLKLTDEPFPKVIFIDDDNEKREMR